MNNNGNEPAFPTVGEGNCKGIAFLYYQDGMTKREHFAAMALQGIVSTDEYSSRNAANLAVEYADALLAELDKKPEVKDETNTL